MSLALDARLRGHDGYRSDLRQHVLAEAAHIVDHRVGRIAAEAEIDRDDAEIAQRPQVAGDRRIVAGAEPTLAVVGALRDARPELREAVGELEVVDVAAGNPRHVAQLGPLDVETTQRVEPVARVRTDRIPGVAEPGGAPHRRAAFAADPDRDPLLHRARLKEDVREPGVFAAEAGVLVGPQFAAHRDRLVGDGAALLERLRADRLEFLAAP